jgi:hypothetical protein
MMLLQNNSVTACLSYERFLWVYSSHFFF